MKKSIAKITDPQIVSAYQHACEAFREKAAHSTTSGPADAEWERELSRLDGRERSAFIRLLGTLDAFIGPLNTARGDNPEGSSPRTEQGEVLGDASLTRK